MLHWKAKTAVGVLLAVGVTAVLIVGHQNDPDYKGKRLSQHLEQVRPGGFSFGGMNIRNGEYPDVPAPPEVEYQCTDGDALDAMSQVGAKAIPLLLRMLQSRDSKARMWFYSLSQKHRIIEMLFHPKPPHAFTDQVRAAAVFYRLGPSGASAASGVVPLLRNPELLT